MVNAGTGAAAPVWFETPEDLRGWLAKHHASATELLVGLWKKDSGKPSITWPELVDECLCVGWIDGVRRSLGEDAYTIRITPRKKGSIWSAVNVRNVARLTAEGRMTPAGLAAFEARETARSGVYSFEQETVALAPAREQAFRAKKRAWAFWEKQPPSYRKVATWWVESAKKEETRETRFAKLVEHSARGERLPQFVSNTKGTKQGKGRT